MNVRQIESLHKALVESGFHHLEVTFGKIKLKLVRNPAISDVLTDSETSAADSGIGQSDPQTHPVTTMNVISERVGIFTFGKRAALEIGVTVKRGEILGTIKGISIQDHVTAPVSGTVTAIFVTEGEIVEFGRRLFILEKEKIEE
ncbi:MAG: biotin/lipoyl-binding protein [Candidatus Riflebacteria bacterium]|nr:biotin/lipoyl-binding protein [Candidatus Riflebacteria bacterium]